MHLSGCLFILLPLLSPVSGFLQISLQATSPQITLFSPYKVTILASFDTVGRFIQQGDNIQTKFPAEVPLFDTTTPSVCYRLDQAGAQHQLTCEVKTGNVVSFNMDAQVDTVVSPLVYVLGPARNPDSVMSTSSFQVYQYRLGSLVDSRTSLLTAQYAPGSLTDYTLSVSNLSVSTPATYTIVFKTQHAVPQYGKLLVVFPTPDIGLGGVSVLTATAKVDSGVKVDLTVAVPATNQLMASGLFEQQGLAAAAGLITLVVSPVTNPDSLRTSQSLTLYTTTKDGNYVDMCSTGLTVTPTKPGIITNLGVTATPSTVSLPALYSFNMSPGLGFPSGGKLTLTLPSALTQSSSISCSFVLGFALTSSASCTLSNNILTTQGVSFTKGADNQYIVFTVSGLTNPGDTVMTTGFQVATYDENGILMCQLVNGAGIKATPGVLNIITASRRSPIVGSDGPYTISFSLSTKIPQFAVIKLVLPVEQVTVASLTCHIVSGASVLQENVCGDGVTTTGAGVEAVMKEWCSSGTAGCAAGTKMTVNLQGVSNLPYVQTGSLTSIEVYTLNQMSTGVIDQVKTNVFFTPSLQAETMTLATCTRSGDIVGLTGIYTFTLSSPISIVPNSLLILTFPAGVMYPDPSGASLQLYLGGSISTSFTTITSYPDTSFNTITLDKVCSQGCNASITVTIKVTGGVNPPYVSSNTGGYTAKWTTEEGFLIAGSNVDSSLIGVFLPDTIQNIAVSRSNDAIQTLVQVTFSFLHPTSLSSAGLISISLPDYALLPAGTVTCTRAIDSTVLGFTYTLYGTGSISSVTISGYCQSQCSKNTLFKVTFAGVRTPLSVRPISGQVSVHTSNSGFMVNTGVISDIGTQLGALIPGNLIAVTIDPYDPTVGVTTTYRVIATSMHGIPAGSVLQIVFPNEISVPESTPGSGNCSAYLLLDSGLQCTSSGNRVIVRQGVVTGFAGSWMFGILIPLIANGLTAGQTGSISLSIQTSEGYTIDTGDGNTRLYTAYTGSCDGSCKTCTGVSSTCNSCLTPSSHPYQRVNTCLSLCPATSFLVTSPSPVTCITCHFTCKECTSSLSTACLSCSEGLVKSDRTCISTCPLGTLPTNGICINSTPCASPCQTCSTSSSFCLSCASDSAYPVLDSVNGRCVANHTSTTDYCPETYYQSGFICAQCDSSCATCTDTSSHCTSCKAIYGRPILNLIDHTCVSTCPVNISIQVDSTCVPCDSSCATCNNTGPKACTKCPISGTKYMTNDGQCVSTCPAGTYHYDNSDGSYACISTCDTENRLFIDGNYCKKCYENCMTCAGPGNQQCVTCDPNSNFTYLTADKQCVSTCPSSQFTSTLNNQLRCYYSCPPPSYNFLTDSGQLICQMTCPGTGYYIDTNTNYCSKCHVSCLTCTNVSDVSCLTCDSTGATPYLTDTHMCVGACPSAMFTLTEGKMCYTSCPSGRFNFDGSEGKVCSESCGDGYWVDSGSNYCRKCFGQCLTCAGGTNKNCVTCPSAYPYLTDDSQCLSSCPPSTFYSALGSSLRCVTQCPVSTYYFTNPISATTSCVSTCNTTSGYFIDSVTNYCSPCDTECKTCITSGACTSCDSSFLTADGHCQSTCPSTQFSYNLNNAKLCYFSCPTPTFNFISIAGVRTCISACASLHYYIDTLTNYCSACESTCLTCSGPTDSNCISCDSSSTFPLLTVDKKCVSECPATMFLYLTTCVLVCPAGMYYSLGTTPGGNKCISTCKPGNYLDGNNYCYPCDSTCMTCSGVTETSCVSCDGSGSVPYLTDTGKCVATCGSLYQYQINNAKKCYTTCPMDTYNYNDPKTGVLQCINTCEAGYYLNTKTNTCYDCHTTCQTCSGSTSTTCLSCTVSYPYLTDANQCVVSCPAGYFQYTIGGVKKCYATCPSGTFNFESVDNGEKSCIAVCGSGFYVEGSYCKQCFSTCQTCSGSGNSSCLTCSKSGQYPYLTDTQQCVSTCTSPSSFTSTSSSLRCYSQCPSGYYKYTDKDGSWCIATCPPGNYIDTAAGYCRQCDGSCMTCNGTSAGNCVTCDVTGQTPYLTDTGYCVATCTSSTYTYQLNGAKRCVSTCPFGSYSYRGSDNIPTCISTCGDGFYLSSDSNTCYPCDTSCLTCKGTSNTDCTSCNKASKFGYITDAGKCVSACPSDLYLYNPSGQQSCVSTCPPGLYNSLSTHTCVSTCSTGFYLSSTTCIPCDSNCRTCLTSGTCLTCDKTSPLPYFTPDQHCVSTCPDSLFLYNPNGEMTCLVTCPQNYYNFDANNTKTCIAQCGDGFYVDKTANYCRKCYNTCKTCGNGTSQGCLTCPETGEMITESGECVSKCQEQYFTYKEEKKCVVKCPEPLYSSYLPEGKICASTCASNYYTELNSNVCKPCAGTCLTCSGGSETQCLSCDTAGLTPKLSSDGSCVSRCPSDQFAYLSQGEPLCVFSCPSGTLAYSLGSKQCLSTCPPGSYPSSGVCLKCDSSCSTCTSGSNKDCTLCASTYVSYQSTCLPACPTGYRALNSVCVVACNQGACESCVAGNVCSVCMPGYILYKATCYESCPDGTYRTKDSCESCDAECGQCSGGMNDQCSECRTGSALYLGKCLAVCPDGLQPIHGTCQVPIPCELPCSQCIENTSDLCTSCPLGLFLHRTNCTSTCPPHTYPNGNLCTDCDSDCEACDTEPSHCVSCGNNTFLTGNHTCEVECGAGFVPNNSTRVCDFVPIPSNDTDVPIETESETGYETASYIPISIHIAVLVAVALVCVSSKLYRPDLHVTPANVLSLLSAVDMLHRLTLLILLWRFSTSIRPFEIAISAGLLVGSICLSMIYLVLYLDPVMETSNSLDLFISSHRLSYRLFRFMAHISGIHFIRMLYGGLYGVELFSNMKTLGNNANFRQPLEKLSMVQFVGMLCTQIIQNVTILALYPVNTDVFLMAIFGVPVNLTVAGVFLVGYFRSTW